jgi:hypothetical protein
MDVFSPAALGSVALLITNENAPFLPQHTWQQECCYDPCNKQAADDMPTPPAIDNCSTDHQTSTSLHGRHWPNSHKDGLRKQL